MAELDGPKRRPTEEVWPTRVQLGGPLGQGLAQVQGDAAGQPERSPCRVTASIS